MYRTIRLVLAALLPVAMTAVFFLIPDILEVGFISSTLDIYLIYLIVGYLYAGLPSLLFSIVLEFSLRKRFYPESFAGFVFIASALGAVAGVLIIIVDYFFLGYDETNVFDLVIRDSYTEFVVYGAIVGLLTALVIWFLYKRES